ncbi:Os10g0139800 [Oryza sativa Japonica Group]|uniref:Os10g0139800 protein n=1 Tax=Oryza sativa subsp. japonica TaxID=39947 RepID=A0A0P0XSB8_ORYSJ|nr:Os10g0139800 [Oryza sativa Japonica Group]
MWSVTAELLLESSRYLTMEHRRRAPPRIADSPPLESSHKEIQTATTVKGERPDAVRTLCRASVNTTTSPAHATHLQDQGGEVGEHEFNGGGGRAIARGGGKRRSLSSPVGLCMEEVL